MANPERLFMPPLIETRDVTKVYGHGRATTVALDHFSYAIEDETASITAVAGESGSGKSTLARLLLGFTTPTSGQVLYRGMDLRKLPRREQAEYRREIQAIFQDPFAVYNPFYKVDHLLLTPITNFGLAKSRRDGRQQIATALETVGLSPGEILGRYPHQLSGGQRQRITIARALLLKPRLIVADEPVSMVDASLRATILESLLTLKRDFGISFVYITHDLTTAYQVADRLIVLYQGGVTEAGAVQPVVREPQHPYTQLLVRSIPSTNPDQGWIAEPVSMLDQGDVKASHGCRFAPRCPYAMPICSTAPPPLYESNGAAVACYLYRDRPVLPAGDLTGILTESQPVAAVSQ
jgi:oligopeptide/dipeptide ABC transporter ATP-binding protein